MIELLNQSSGDLKMPWKKGIAVGRAYELLRADLLEHLAKAQREIGFGYCRFHGIFHDDMCVAVRRPDGKLAFQWHQIDKIYDSLLAMGLRPLVELGAMPKVMASGTQTMFEWKMNITPPSSYIEWGQLVREFTQHLVDRYGLAEVKNWLFEVWNEPNLSCFWSGSQEEYWKLYDASAFAVKSVCPELRIGGPATSKASWIEETIAHCHEAGVPLDFISTHLYPQDEYVDYNDRQGSPYPPGHYFVETLRKARQRVASSQMPNLPIHWTEFNSLSTGTSKKISWTENPSVDSLYAASFVARSCTELDNDCDSMCWWTVSDIFEESGMPHSPFSCTYGLLTIHGIPKASYNAFKMLAKMQGARVNVEAASLPDGCGLVATKAGQSIRVLLWNNSYPGREQIKWQDTLTLPAPGGLDDPCQALTSRIKASAGSPYETWCDIGKPHNLSTSQMELLVAHSQPEMRAFAVRPANSQVQIEITLEPNEVLYLELSPLGISVMPRCANAADVSLWDLGMGEKSR